MTKHRKDRRDLIVTAIANFRALHGYGPSVREVGDIVNLASTSAVHMHLIILEREGRITWDRKHARTLAVVGPVAPSDLVVELTSRALHRWRHPTFRGWDRCRCQQDAREALSLVGAGA